MIEKIKNKIRTIPNFPKHGIMFRDITTLLKDAEGLKLMVEDFYERYKNKKIDAVVGIESRGFILGTAIAYKLGTGFILIRKPGKLPAATKSMEYELEYGKDKIEIHEDAINSGDKILLVDDLIATGGTMNAAIDLVEQCGGEIVECVCIVDLPEIGGSKKILEKGYKVYSQVEFDGE